MGLDYRTTDDSNRADRRVSFVSGTVPIGSCIHTTAGSDSKEWLLGGSAKAGRPASCDFLIDRDGTRHKICPDYRRPYHVGKARFPFASGIKTGDELSALLVGWELEQQGDELCTWQQLDSLAAGIVTCAGVYGWRWPFFMVGHYQLAQPLGRRSDPQGFDWGGFMGFLYARSREAGVPGLAGFP